MSVEELLASLPADERVAVQLCSLPGRTYRAVAEVIGEEPAVVLARLRRGLARLRSTQEVAGHVLPQLHGQGQRLQVDPLVLAVEP